MPAHPAPARLIGPRPTGPRFNMTAESPLASVPAPPAQGTLASSQDVHDVVAASLAGKFASDPGIRYGDEQFYLPSLDEIAWILGESQLDRRTWLQNRFDCDDFAYVLKGEMSSHAYANAELTCGLCVGIAWGNFDWLEGNHAVNWFIDSTGTLGFIEPQDDRIFPASSCTGNLYLLLA